MSSVTNLMRTTAVLCLVTMFMRLTSGDAAAKSNNSSTIIERLREPVKRFVWENFKYSKRRINNRKMKFDTSFEDNKSIIRTMLAKNDKQIHNYNTNSIPLNTFKCPPCVCKNISSNLVSVFCIDCLLTGIPQNWPIEIYTIIITCHKYTNLEVLDLSSLLLYTSLTRVKIMTFRIFKVFSSSDLNVSSTMIDLDLHGNKISTVEKKCFSIFPNLLKLSLRYNKITNLTKELFTGLRSLSYLSVAANNINFIANDTFDDMGNLVTLDISKNNIIYTGDELLPIGIFFPLRNLKELYINQMCKRGTYQCGSYPNKALQVLTNLKLLAIDGADSRGLGPEVKSLVHLRHLIITFPHSDNVSDDSYFDNAPSLTTLRLYTFFQNMPPKAFSNLKNLENFTYFSSSFNGHEDLCKVLIKIKYLPKFSLKYLTLSHINDPKTGCKKVNAEEAVYLKLFNLIELDLSGNNLMYLSSDFIALLPRTLKKIDLSKNSLSFKLFYSLEKFPENLQELILNYQVRKMDEDNSKRLKVDIKNKLISKISDNSTFNETASAFKDPIMETIEVSKYKLPPNLQILRADNFKIFGSTMWEDLDTDCTYSLKTLSLVKSQFRHWHDNIFLNSIEMADFSHNRHPIFDNNFFPENNSLKYFTMSNNLLREEWKYNLFFANTRKLISVDLSTNSFTQIPDDYFRNLFKLRILDVSDNKLQMINISFSHMTELRFLDLSINSITSISKQSRDDLDIIAADHRVYLDLTSNPLLCTCEVLELMKWMAFTNVFLLNRDFLVCRNEFNEELEIGNIVQRMEILQRQCTSKTVIIFTCAFSITVFSILLITSLMYRYRWKLRYLRSIALVKLFGSRPAANNMIGYRFDAYILYTDDTQRFVLRDCVRELEEKRGHRLCIEDRDFLPGIYNVSQIVSAVQNSAKTVAMVTPEFYEGDYSEYSVKMALMEEIFMRRSVLFLCVCEPTDDKYLSHDLLTAMKQNNYIEYPPIDDANYEIFEEFWNQFSRYIGKMNVRRFNFVLNRKKKS